MHGRFTSVDPLTASASIRDPQTFNRYSYVLNSPYKFTDPLGLAACSAQYSYNDCGGDSGFWGGDYGDDTAYLNSVPGGAAGLRNHSIMTDGYDPELDQFVGDVTIEYNTGACGQGVTAQCGGSITLDRPSLDDVNAARAWAGGRIDAERSTVGNILRRQKAASAIASTGLGRIISNLTPAREGFVFRVIGVQNERAFESFLAANFLPKGGGGLYGYHKDDVGGCGVGSKCKDYRSRRNSMGIAGSMQIVFDSNSQHGYVDIDRFNPYQGSRGFLGHAFLEVLNKPSIAYTGTNLDRLSTLRNRYQRYGR